MTGTDQTYPKKGPFPGMGAVGAFWGNPCRRGAGVRGGWFASPAGLRTVVRGVIAGLVVAVLLCGTTVGRAARPAAETEALAAFVNEVARPGLAELADSAVRLEARVKALCKTPTAGTLGEARTAWREAWLSWRRAGPLLFGPGSGLERGIGKWDVNGVVLDAAVESPELSHLLRQTDQRGYAAVEYLLFTPADAAAATTAGRRAHLLDTTGEIVRLTARVRQEWEDGFAREFTSAGDGKPFLTPADALSRVFSRTLNVIERTLRDRIGLPSGFFGRSPARPEDLEAWRSGSTRAGFQATLEGIRRTLEGGGDAGLQRLIATHDGLVEVRNPKLADAIGRQLGKIEKTLADLGGDDLALEAEVRKNPAKLKRLYGRLQTLQDQLVEASLVLELDVYGGTKSLLATDPK